MGLGDWGKEMAKAAAGGPAVFTGPGICKYIVLFSRVECRLPMLGDRGAA